MTHLSPRPFYLDCDTGVDDALALAYLLASPSVDLRGIGTVSGNIDAATAARNTLDLLALLDRVDVPVAVGAHDPLVGRFNGGAPHVHGENGIGNIVLPTVPGSPVAGSAAELLVELARAHAGTLEVVAIGPLTNLAHALRLEPHLPELVAGVTIMGGAALAPGNVSPVAEANIANDPEAAAVVFDAGWPITLVPLDVTMTNVLEETHRQALRRIEHAVAAPLAAMLEHYFGFYVDILGRPASAMHDPLAAALAVGAVTATLAPVVEVSVDTTDGPGRGQTICDLRGRYAGYPSQRDAHCRVVLELGADFAPHLIEVLERLVATAPRTSGGLTVVGSLNTDVVAVGTRLPTAGETVGGGRLTRQVGGKGANQAVAAARLAGRSRMIGAVGSDADGDALVAALEAAGVDTRDVRRGQQPTGTALIVVDPDGENQIALCTGANGEVSLDDVTFAPDEVVLCQLEIDQTVVVEAARRAPGFFALNAAPAQPLAAELIERCDLIIVNESEYVLLPELREARLVAVTYGGQGSALFEYGRQIAWAAGHQVPVVNTIGAGDAFCATLVLGLSSGLEPETALRIANLVGAEAVGDPSSQPDLAPLADYLGRVRDLVAA